MVDGEDPLSDSSEITDERTHFKCCENRLRNVKVCVNCFSFYHKSCAKRNTNMKILSEGRLICCERPDNDKQQEEDEETKYDGKKMLLMEISLLLEKIDILVKDQNNHEANKPNNTPINVTAIRQTCLPSTSRQQNMALPAASYSSAVSNSHTLQVPEITSRKHTLETSEYLKYNDRNKQIENDGKFPVASNKNKNKDVDFTEVKYKKSRIDNQKKSIGTGKRQTYQEFTGPARKCSFSSVFHVWLVSIVSNHDVIESL
ncbi:hypothetical protein WA026_012695 [Henosepilachna vigintioctopunctata]|uniref:Uncharacterized protein n=1 Tax=Henosepilachna vigintioctopunctata TaxID=420089 RepID=A0AAW1U6V0_9CUCU